MTNANPFAQRSTLEYELPPFADIKVEHYLPAFYEGCTQQLAEVKAILDTPGAATFENTIVALEKSGQMLMRQQITRIICTALVVQHVLVRPELL